jgi:hypothetical protein
MNRCHSILIAALLAATGVGFSLAQEPTQLLDSDHDGLSDAQEQALLAQFAPNFMVGRSDCSGVPAEFLPEVEKPTVKAENRTIYGEVFPVETPAGTARRAEVHYYHLWRLDCGEHGHPLDAEHVSVLVQASTANSLPARWDALYWYAGAHENTVCDVSQIGRASTLAAQDRGATIWISPNKHASYLNPAVCQRGCGADRCQAMEALHSRNIVNLGEPGHPMNGSLFISSNLWPLKEKMASTNFPADAIARLNQLPQDEIAWFNPGRHPAQGVISISSSTEGALANSGQNTVSALSLAGGNTENALEKSYQNTTHSLGNAFRHVTKALSVTSGNNPQQ